MKPWQRKRKAAATAAAMQAAVADMIEAGAVGFHLVALMPDGEYQDAFDTDDVAAMTAAVNDSALKARIEVNRGHSIATVN